MSLEAVVETEKHRKLIKRYSGKQGRATLTAANLAILDTSVYIAKSGFDPKLALRFCVAPGYRQLAQNDGLILP